MRGIYVLSGMGTINLGPVTLLIASAGEAWLRENIMGVLATATTVDILVPRIVGAGGSISSLPVGKAFATAKRVVRPRISVGSRVEHVPASQFPSLGVRSSSTRTTFPARGYGTCSAVVKLSPAMSKPPCAELCSNDGSSKAETWQKRRYRTKKESAQLIIPARARAPLARKAGAAMVPSVTKTVVSGYYADAETQSMENIKGQKPS